MLAVLAFCSSAALSAAAPGASVSATPFQKSDRWCAVGDSITHGGEWTKWIYLYYVTRYPDARFEPINRGSGGDTAPNCLLRFDEDIAPTRPTVATIMFGINDIWWEHSKLIGPNDYIQSVGTLVDRLKAMDSRVVLIAPPPYDATAENATALDPLRGGLERYVEQLREYAEQKQLPLIDFYHPMLELAAKKQAQTPTFSLFESDRVHPNAAGGLVMAYLFLKSQGCGATVSEVVLDVAARSVAKNDRCQTRDAEISKRSVTFSMLAESLPFPVQGIAAETLGLVPFMQDLNRETFAMKGLEPGQYELLIDGEHIANYPHTDLAKGVNLAEIAATPQNRQAQRVAELNAKRHDIVSQKLRYIRMLEHGQLRRFFADDDVESARPVVQAFLAPITDPKQAAELKKTYDLYFEYKAQQSKLAKEADEYLDRIFKENRPAWHRYELRPLVTK